MGSTALRTLACKRVVLRVITEEGKVVFLGVRFLISLVFFICSIILRMCLPKSLLHLKWNARYSTSANPLGSILAFFQISGISIQFFITVGLKLGIYWSNFFLFGTDLDSKCLPLPCASLFFQECKICASLHETHWNHLCEVTWCQVCCRATDGNYIISRNRSVHFSLFISGFFNAFWFISFPSVSDWFLSM